MTGTCHCTQLLAEKESPEVFALPGTTVFPIPDFQIPKTADVNHWVCQRKEGDGNKSELFQKHSGLFFKPCFTLVFLLEK
jgi:hypothetical protein